MKGSLFTLGLLLTLLTATAQWNVPLKQLQQHVKDSKYNDSLGNRNALYNRSGFQYLQPLYGPLLALPHDHKKHATENFAGAASAFAFAGDYATATQLSAWYYDSLPPEAYREIDRYIDTLRKPQLTDAKNYIVQRAADQRVVMINYTPALAQQTAFAASLLEPLYKKGFRYLALEALNSRADRNPQSVDLRSGFQTAEPVMGELMRKALSLGFVLLPYEDSSRQQSAVGREAKQAATLASLFKQDSSARLLVIATGAHISEQSVGQQYTPMALFFKRFTQIDPLTIDQTEMGEAGAFEYGRYFYEKWQKKNGFDTAVIALRQGQPVSLLEATQYDLQVIHPPAKMKNRRPDWLNFNSTRRMFAVKPTERKLFLAQAYYADELKEKNMPVLVPADQTYVSDEDGYYWLYLLPGKYKLVMRDVDYNLLSEKDIDVN